MIIVKDLKITNMVKITISLRRYLTPLCSGYMVTYEANEMQEV